jgi:hypothetical protein
MVLFARTSLREAPAVPQYNEIRWEHSQYLILQGINGVCSTSRVKVVRSCLFIGPEGLSLRFHQALVLDTGVRVDVGHPLPTPTSERFPTYDL